MTCGAKGHIRGWMRGWAVETRPVGADSTVLLPRKFSSSPSHSEHDGGAWLTSSLKNVNHVKNLKKIS